MDKKDLLTFILAIVFVIVIALITHPPDFGNGNTSGVSATGETSQDQGAQDYCTESSCCSDKVQITYLTERADPPFAIEYNTDLDSIYSKGAQGYPRLHLPGTVYVPSGNFYVPAESSGQQTTAMDTYIFSDILSENVWGDSTDNDSVMTFAYMEGSKSGFSKIFGVPYPIWRIKCTMVPKGNPAYSQLMWVLVDSSTGDLITGGNIFPEGQIIREITISNEEMYFIIEAENVLSFDMELQTPMITYQNEYPKPEEGKIIDFLNTLNI